MNTATTTTDCTHPVTAAAGPAHRRLGAQRFCTACYALFAADGNLVTIQTGAVRNTLADRLDAASRRFGVSDRHPLSNVVRRGGRLD